MIHKILIGAPVAGLLLLGASVQMSASPASRARQAAQQQNQQEQTVTGKVTSIGSDRRSFSLEVDEGGSKKTMQFVLDNKTQVQGRVTEGTMAKVEFQPMEGGKNLAIIVTAQS